MSSYHDLRSLALGKRSFQIRQLFIQKTKMKHILIGFQLTLPGQREAESRKRPAQPACSLPGPHPLQVSPYLDCWEGSERAKVHKCFMTTGAMISPPEFLSTGEKSVQGCKYP